VLDLVKAVIQSLVAELQTRERGAERALVERQIWVSLCANWITASGILLNLIGLLFIYQSFLISREAANAAKVAAGAANEQVAAMVSANSDASDALHKSQRPWIVVDDVVRFQDRAETSLSQRT
jgi:hypothetical protein